MNYSNNNRDTDVEDENYREFYIQYRLMSQSNNSFRGSARTVLSSIEEKKSYSAFRWDWQTLSHKSFNQLFAALFKHFGSEYFDNLSFLNDETQDQYQAIKTFFNSYLDNNKLSFKYPDDIEIDYFFENGRIVERSTTRYDILQENFRQSLNTDVEGICWLLRRFFKHLKRGRDLNLIDSFRESK